MAKKILVIDDEITILEMVRLRLEASNYEVITALDGYQGLQKVKNEKPDLIILDIVMPAVDGYTFIKKIQVDAALAKIPIIILSGKDKMQDLFEAEGVKDYIIKPFDSEELVQKVAKYLK